MAKTMQKANAKRVTAAQAIVDCIKLEDIRTTFCVPGESYLAVLDALHDAKDIRLISARHESGAAFMAEGYAKSTLKPGIVFATRGVGAANLSIGVHTAYQDSTPMVVFLGQVHRDFKGREGFQEVDLEAFFRPITKWTVEVTDPNRTVEMVQRAFRIAQSGRPGPVVVSLPEDVLPVETDVYYGPQFKKSTPRPSVKEIKQVEMVLEKSKQPVIIAGGGVKSAQAEETLVQFAQKYNVPVMTSFRRHDAFPNDHGLYGGHLGLGANPNILKTVKEADTILAFGTRLSEVTTQDYRLIRNDQALIHIDIEPGTIGKVYPPEIGIVGDLREALTGLTAIQLTGSWEEWTKSANQRYLAASNLEVTEDDVINKHIIAYLVERLPKHALLTNDAGNFAGWMHAYYPFTKKHTYVGPTSGAMGYGMPAALGAKLAFPEKTVVALAGDGGFMMTVQELETAVRNDIPVICLVFNNEMYGTIRMHQEKHYPHRVVGTDLGAVSFANLAKSVGANGYRVHDMDEFTTCFETAMNENSPTVIEVMTLKENISVTSTISDIRKQTGT
ncbi:MAG TPA: thiamine pyrophosphate-dependent enzyme [Bacillota bacterium]|nr:thiamine pyrophosphate-dependent enzyme [Bacillota bacterium]